MVNVRLLYERLLAPHTSEKFNGMLSEPVTEDQSVGTLIKRSKPA